MECIKACLIEKLKLQNKRLRGRNLYLKILEKDIKTEIIDTTWKGDFSFFYYKKTKIVVI
jgi:hypothetical protein